MSVLVTGGTGFLGRHLVKRLLHEHDVVIYDRKPKPDHLPHYDIQTDTMLDYVEGDVMDDAGLMNAMQQVQPEIVFHLAALADVRNALKQPAQQLDLNLVATFHVLEAMKAAKVPRIAFTSSAVVYGDTPSAPKFCNHAGHNPYNCPNIGLHAISERSYCFPQQTSIYGAMKLASESLIAAYCEGFGMTADIYRLVSVVGAGYRHGNLMDFYTRLKENPRTLKLFGSPTQQKYYIAVEDVIDAMMLITARAHRGCELWNVSHDQPNTISDSIAAACLGLGINWPDIQGGDSWPGDLPQLVLDCSKLRALGWAPHVSIRDAMAATIADLKGRHS